MFLCVASIPSPQCVSASSENQPDGEKKVDFVQFCLSSIKPDCAAVTELLRRLGCLIGAAPVTAFVGWLSPEAIGQWPAGPLNYWRIRKWPSAENGSPCRNLLAATNVDGVNPVPVQFRFNRCSTKFRYNSGDDGIEFGRTV